MAVDSVPSDPLQVAQELLQRALAELEIIPSPQNMYNARSTAIWAAIHEAFDRFTTTPDSPDIRREIVEYGGSLKELEREHDKTICSAKDAYFAKRRSILEQLCRQLAIALGPPLTTLLSQVEPHDAARDKRRSDMDSDGSAVSRKRLRSDRDGDFVNSVTFDEVFQDGKARIKQIIVQYPVEDGDWYVIRCQEHSLVFADFVSAGGHISSTLHGKLSRGKASVIRHLGLRVIGCDSELAERNNVAARKDSRKSIGDSSIISEPDRRSQSPLVLPTILPRPAVSPSDFVEKSE